jgi:Predicted 3'-5' exonuclease related to the exonuclease domain of PolB
MRRTNAACSLRAPFSECVGIEQRTIGALVRTAIDHKELAEARVDFADAVAVHDRDRLLAEVLSDQTAIFLVANALDQCEACGRVVPIDVVHRSLHGHSRVLVASKRLLMGQFLCPTRPLQIHIVSVSPPFHYNLRRPNLFQLILPSRVIPCGLYIVDNNEAKLWVDFKDIFIFVVSSLFNHAVNFSGLPDRASDFLQIKPWSWHTRRLPSSVAPDLTWLVLLQIKSEIRLVASRQPEGWRMDALGAPHVGERPEAKLIRDFVERIGQLRPQLITFNGHSFDLPVLRYC